MTDNEIKVLVHLCNVRGRNNTDEVIAEAVKLTEFDVKEAADLLEKKKYIYIENTQNQTNMNERAWKIWPAGELKAKEFIDRTENSFAQRVKKFLAKYWIPVGIISFVGAYILGILSPVFSDMAKEKFLPKTKDTIELTTTVHDTIYLAPNDTLNKK